MPRGRQPAPQRPAALPTSENWRIWPVPDTARIWTTSPPAPWQRSAGRGHRSRLNRRRPACSRRRRTPSPWHTAPTPAARTRCASAGASGQPGSHSASRSAAAGPATPVITSQPASTAGSVAPTGPRSVSHHPARASPGGTSTRSAPVASRATRAPAESTQTRARRAAITHRPIPARGNISGARSGSRSAGLTGAGPVPPSHRSSAPVVNARSRSPADADPPSPSLNPAPPPRRVAPARRQRPARPARAATGPLPAGR